jgi:hypothetical protein
LIDTGATKSFISQGWGLKLIEEGMVVREGKFKVIDAFGKSHVLSGLINLKFSIENSINKLFELEAILVEMPLAFDVIIGWEDIRRLKVFELMPDLLEDDAPNLTVGGRPDQSATEGEETRIQIGNGYKGAAERNFDELTHPVATAKAKVGSGKGDSLPEVHLKSCQEEKGARILNESPVVSKVSFLAPYVLSKGAEMSPYEREDIDELIQSPLEAIPSEALLPEMSRDVPDLIFGPECFKNKINVILRKFVTCFSKTVSERPARVSPFVLEVDKSLWHKRENRVGPRKHGSVREAELKRQCEVLQTLGVIRRSVEGYYSHAFLVPKPNGEWRFVLDFKNLNKATVNSERWPIPNIGSVLRRIGEKKPEFFGLMDLTSGFFQAPIEEGSRRYTAFMTPEGVFEWNRLPMGIMAAPSYFQRVISTEVLGSLIGVVCELYIDDVIVFGKMRRNFFDQSRNGSQTV